VKVAYLALAIAFLAAFTASANAFEMVLSTDSLIVHTGETKTIDLAVVSAADDVIIFATPIEQPWMSMPTHIPVSASQQATAKLSFAPFDRTEPGAYKFLLALQSLKTGERRERNITITVSVAEVAIERIVIGGALEPNGYGQLDIHVKNYEEKTADIIVDVDAANFLKFTETLMLAPGEFKTIKRGFNIPECQASGEYIVHADVKSKNVDVFSVDQAFVIPEKFMQVTSINQTQSGFRSDTVVTIKNVGNIDGIAEYSEHILGVLFFAGDRPARTDDGFRWFLNMDACETRTIHYQVDYTPIPVTLFVLFAIWYVFFRLRTIHVKKRILQKATIEKGLEFTVGIDVKSWITGKEVEIRDFVPSLFEVRDTPGIKPVKRKTEAGTELVWRFKSFVPYEERILDYRIVPLFGISGEIDLPRVVVSFNYLGRRITKRSPATKLGLKFTEHVKRAGDFFSGIGELVGKALKKKA